MSSSREEILASVRGALADVRSEPDGSTSIRADGPASAPAPESEPLLHSMEDVVALFAERVADFRATVVRADVAADAVADAVCEYDVGSLVVPSDLDTAWLAHVDPAVVRTDGDPLLSAVQLDQLDAVLTGAVVGIADTGTVVLEHVGPGQGRRVISLVPDIHVCVVLADQVVASVPDAMSRLDPSRPQTWISGPSATSDIELNRVEGVHGPRTLHVIVIG
ncbi:MAG: LutC/YkgG family protein [Nocardioidaceae bacterium]